MHQTKKFSLEWEQSFEKLVRSAGNFVCCISRVVNVCVESCLSKQLFVCVLNKHDVFVIYKKTHTEVTVYVAKQIVVSCFRNLDFEQGLSLVLNKVLNGTSVWGCFQNGCLCFCQLFAIS